MSHATPARPQLSLPLSPLSPSPLPASADAAPHAWPTAQTGSAVVQIEQIIEAVFDGLARGSALSIPFSRRATRRPGTAGPASSAARPCRGAVSFPGKTAAESKLFTQVLSILQLSHQALVSGTFVTKRNLFYQYRDLFREQRIADDLVDDIAYTLGTGRDSLHIVAASVGVVCGQLSVTTSDNVCCPASGQESGIAIPPPRDIHGLDLSSCQWILVIEKEATFRTLAAAGYWSSSMAGPGALVTSKGYPTLVTRWFLHRVHTTAPRLPIYGLVDYDPHGIRILRTYKYGSRSLRHEDNTTVPGMRWLGIQSRDLGLSAGGCLASRASAWSALDDVLPLTAADRKTAASLLNEIGHSESYADHDASALAQYREVQVMLVLNVKAEMQAADDHGDLAAWLDEKLQEMQGG